LLDAQALETFSGFGRKHGRAIVRQKSSRKASLLKALAETVHKAGGVFPVDGVPLRVATESGTVIERSKQDYGFPVTVGGKDLAFAFVKV
jgi:hypothetical protein